MFMNRREMLQWLGAAGLGLSATRGFGEELPKIDRPILFNTPEADAILERMSIFPPGDSWHQDVSRWPKHTNSDAIVASAGVDKPLRCNYDMNFVIVPPNQKKIRVEIRGYPGESDHGPFPIPENALVEGWPFPHYPNSKLVGSSISDYQRNSRKVEGDRHVIIVDPGNGKFHEFFSSIRRDAGWSFSQASTFDLGLNEPRPDGWTSADAAGLPIFPAVVRYDELKRGRIDHALRVTIQRTRSAYVWPARHFASQDGSKDLPRMGERLRLRADYDTSSASATTRLILEALKRHGVIVADNGLDWAMSVAPDPRIPAIDEELRKVKGGDFEVVVDPASPDYRALRGRWRYVNMRDDGLDADAKRIDGSSLAIGERSFQMKGPDGTVHGVFNLDATHNPRCIDISVREKNGEVRTSQGIYEIKGDYWRACLAPAGKPRPQSFESNKGDALSLRVLKREG